VALPPSPSSEIFQLPGRLNFRRCSSRRSPCSARPPKVYGRHSVASRFAAQRRKSRARVREFLAGVLANRERRERRSRKVIRSGSRRDLRERVHRLPRDSAEGTLRSDDDRIDPLERARLRYRAIILSPYVSPRFTSDRAIHPGFADSHDPRSPERRNSRYIALHAPPARSVSDPRATIKGNS